MKFFGVIAVFALVLLSACNSDSGFTQQAVTQYFLQDYNPEFIDVLWMVDDRTSLAFNPNATNHLKNEATKFFVRLDQQASRDYRMAFVSADLELSSPGELRPRGNPVILTKNFGDLSSRANYFASLLSATVNLHTGALNQGLGSVRAALTSTFQPRASIPLIVVMISDGDDVSQSVSSANAIDYYAAEYLRLKENKADLLRVYSINYTANGARCATVHNADIDRPGFNDRYFKVAEKLGTSGQKADLCTAWADQINLDGIKLKELKKRFKLDSTPNVSTLQVLVFDAANQSIPLAWKYEAATNEIVFDVTPPAGTTIQVMYHFE